MSPVRVDYRFKSQTPPLKPSEFKLLEESILAEGCREPLTVCIVDEDEENPSIIDGHNRYEICTKHDIPYSTRWSEPKRMTFLEAMLWIILNQLGRRNCCVAWKIELFLSQKDLLLQAGREARIESGKQTGRGHIKVLSGNDRIFPPHSTRAAIADAVGVSTGLVGMAEQIRKRNPELWEKVKSEEISISGAYDQLNDKETNKVHVTHNSKDDEWYTPSEFVEAARTVLGGIDLDPASSEFANRIIKAKKYYDIEDDGLEFDWRGTVWMNPPYSTKLVEKFINKLASSFRSEDVTEAVVLVNNATDTKWFAELAEVSSCVCFPNGRIRFLKTDGERNSPLQGQALAYLGTNDEMFVNEFSKFGIVVKIIKC